MYSVPVNPNFTFIFLPIRKDFFFQKVNFIIWKKEKNSENLLRDKGVHLGYGAKCDKAFASEYPWRIRRHSLQKIYYYTSNGSGIEHLDIKDIRSWHFISIVAVQKFYIYRHFIYITDNNYWTTLVIFMHILLHQNAYMNTC